MQPLPYEEFVPISTPAEPEYSYTTAHAVVSTNVYDSVPHSNSFKESGMPTDDNTVIYTMCEEVKEYSN